MTYDYTKTTELLRSARKAKKGDNIVTPLARMSWPFLFEARSNKAQPDSEPKYSVSLLIPDIFDTSLLKADATRAAKEKWGDKIPSNLKSPFLDAGNYQYEGYKKGWVLIRAANKNRPSVIDGKTMKPMTIDDEPDVYGGRWCVASLNAYAYDVSGNKGVSFGLNNIMVMDHDDSLSSRAKAEDEFEAVDGYDSGVKPETADSLF